MSLLGSPEETELIQLIDAVVPEASAVSREFCGADATITREALEERVARFLEVRHDQRSGMTVTEQLQRSSAFHNPSMLATLVEYAGVDEYGTHIPVEDWFQRQIDPSDFYDEIERERGRSHLVRTHHQQTRNRLDFVAATTSQTPDPVDSGDREDGFGG